MPVISVRLDNELNERYQALAQITDRSKTYYISKALSEAIDKLEWEFGILNDVEEIRAGKQHTRSLDEVMSDYDI